MITLQQVNIQLQQAWDWIRFRNCSALDQLTILESIQYTLSLLYQTFWSIDEKNNTKVQFQ
jgi:hypothetical protein